MSENKNGDAPQDGSVPQPSNELLKAREEAEKLKNDYLYLRAEFDNYKKHMLKERSELLKFGAERFIRDLLTVVDNFERALSVQVTAESFQSFKQGVEITAQEMKSLLSKHGVQEVACEGQAFDPSVHEALSSEPTNSVPPGHISRVFQKAYKYHEKLLRPAQVVVAQKVES